MDIVLILIGLAVIAAIAFLVLRRDGGDVAEVESATDRGEDRRPEGEAMRPVEPMEPASGTAESTERERQPSGAPPQAEAVGRAEESAGRTEGGAETAEAPRAAGSEPDVGEQAGPEVGAAAEEAEAPPALDPEELKRRVDELLSDSDRMLRDLREAVAEDSPAAGSVEILGEGLEEVRRLAEKERWDQAKNKGEALRAQLSLMLQNARREGSS